MIDAMDADRELADAFARLTQGRPRGWALHFSAPKKAETERTRIDRARASIPDGKGPHDR